MRWGLWSSLVAAAVLASHSVAGEDPVATATEEILGILTNPDVYDPAIRPSVADGSATEVQIQTYFRNIDIDDVNMKANFDITFRMIWNDERLTFNTGGVEYVTVLNPYLAWLPDAFFKNAITTQRKSIHPEAYLRIFPDGRVIYSTRLSLKQSCPMDLVRFPHDTQVCHINVASYGYTSDSLVFTMAAESAIAISRELHADRFSFEKYDTGSCDTETATGVYSCVEVNMKIRRVFGSYLLEMYIPTIFLVIVAWFGFLIPPSQFLGRLLLTLIPLITLASFSNLYKESLASVPYIRAVDIFTGISLVIIFGTLVHVIVCQVRGNNTQADKQSESPEEGEVKGTSEETSGLRRLLAKATQRASFLSRLVLVGTYCAFLFVYFVAYCGTG
ncbi:glutamate-gated chloride channel [Procambarus clarkii]|uniref:glutamate-gated chloride channel n=1 Tax=Procambarus clarkii TaxID=6728 RepID=UPI001E672776|nr:glutamate-gated chloride channel-like isoform X2 [Procambarus clarkii]